MSYTNRQLASCRTKLASNRSRRTGRRRTPATPSHSGIVGLHPAERSTPKSTRFTAGFLRRLLLTLKRELSASMRSWQRWNRIHIFDAMTWSPDPGPLLTHATVTIDKVHMTYCSPFIKTVTIVPFSRCCQLFVKSRIFLHHVCLALLMEVISLEFHRDLWQHKTQIPTLPCGIVYLGLDAGLRQTYRQTDMGSYGQQ